MIHKNSIKLVLIIGTAILFSILFAELTLRKIYPKSTIKWQNDEILGTRLIPNQNGVYVSNSGEYQTNIEINSQGLRDAEHDFSKPEGVFRILILGDSFVENFQVPLEQTFFRNLEKELNKKSEGKKTEVIALGFGNTGTAQQYIALKEYGLKYNPDIVLQLFYLGNDIKNNSQELNNNPYVPYLKFENGEVVIIPPNLKKESTLKEKLKQLKLVKLLLSIRQNILQEKQDNKWNYPIDYHVYDREYIKEYKDAWELTEKIILQTKTLCDVNNAEYILISIPAKEQVYDEIWKGILKKFKISKNSMDLEKPDKLIEDFCNKNKINYDSSLTYFKNREKETHEKSYFPLDGHWTKRGTDEIFTFLVDTISHKM